MTDHADQQHSDDAGVSLPEQALRYLEQGRPIFPVCSPLLGSHKHWDGQKMATCPADRRGKLPLVKWKPYQTELPTEVQVRSWWAKWPTANIGMATGTLSGVIVLDCDSNQAKRQAMENGGLSETPAVFTGKPGGVHFHLAHPGRPVSNFTRKRPGLDFRGDGGYVLLPPSRHVSGATYRWVTGTEALSPATIPSWLDELLTEPGEGGAHEPLNLTEILNGTPDGERDTTIFRFACKMRGDNVERQYADMIVEQAARACKPPFPVEIALGKVAEAYRKYEPNPVFTVGGTGRVEADDAPPAEPKTLAEVLETFKRWLYFDDDGPVLATLAAIAANLLPGDPLWLMLVGPSSGGKTELVNAASRLAYTRLASVLTEAALLSGTPKRHRATTARGGLLREVGDFGILLLKDFTSILSMNREPRAALLAAFREIYDGTWTRHMGTDGGQSLTWRGKLGLVACCTTIIDAHHAVTAAMGERFLFYRFPESNGRAQAERAIQNFGHEREMRDELAEAVAGLFAGITPPEQPPALSTLENRRLIALGSLAARSRSSVERDARTREIELIPDPEAPARLAQALRRLYGGCGVIGMQPRDAWRLVLEVGLDCMPRLRRSVFDYLVRHQDWPTTTAIATSVGYPTTTARRSLEDLVVHGLVVRRSAGVGLTDTWSLSRQARAWYEAAATFPEV